MYQKIKAAAERAGESNDCSVKALALTTKLTYGQAHKALRKLGRKKRKGTSLSALLAAYEDVGYSAKPIDFRAKTVATVPKDPSFQAGESYLVHVRGHVLAVQGRDVLDWTAGRRYRILTVYHVVPKD